MTPRPLDSAAALSADELRARALSDGVIFLPGLLPAAGVAALRARVERACAARGWVVDGRTDPALRFGAWNDSRWLGFVGEVAGSAEYAALARAPALLGAMRAVMAAEPTLHVGDVCRLVSPAAHELTTPPHQDAAYLREPDGVWTAWLPVGPCPEELGPLALLTGSQHRGLLPHDHAPDDSPMVVGLSVPADAPWRVSPFDEGDVVLFSALTIHRALPNRTPDRLRISVNYRYRPVAPSRG